MDSEAGCRLNESPPTEKRAVSRLSTPSTICSDSEDQFHAYGTTLYDVFEPDVGLAERDSFSIGRNRLQSIEFARGPFAFPTVTTNESSRPICIICRNELHTGNVCKELKACGHCFHSACLDDFAPSHSRCPVCRVRFRVSKSKDEKRKPSKPYWSPDYDRQLLSMSDKIDRERRLRKYLLKGKRDNVPKSYLFLRSGLPTLVEESRESLETDDGTLLSLCKCIAREREIQRVRNIRTWSKDMRRLAVTFIFSVICLYIDQTVFADLFQKKLKHTFSRKSHNTGTNAT